MLLILSYKNQHSKKKKEIKLLVAVPMEKTPYSTPIYINGLLHTTNQFNMWWGFTSIHSTAVKCKCVNCKHRVTGHFGKLSILYNR